MCSSWIISLIPLLIYHTRASLTTEVNFIKLQSNKLIESCSNFDTSSNLHYFDSIYHKCQVCDTNTIPNSLDLSVYGDSLSCTCSIGYKKIYNDCTLVSRYLVIFQLYNRLTL